MASTFKLERSQHIDVNGPEELQKITEVRTQQSVNRGKCDYTASNEENQ